jgi:hypothetical protein
VVLQGRVTVPFVVPGRVNRKFCTIIGFGPVLKRIRGIRISVLLLVVAAAKE